MFAIAWALMVVNHLDRQVVVSMFPHLKAQWDLSDRQLGGLVSIVAIVVALGAVPLSLLADRWGRAKGIVLMGLLWSAATIACAWAGSYAQLLALRGVVGFGEAAFGSAGAALLAGLFPARMRSTVLGAFLAAAVAGSLLGVVLGGVITQRWGWPVGFAAAGVPGVVLALLFRRIARDGPESAPAVAQDKARGRSMTAKNVVAALLEPRTALVACVGAGLQLMTVSTIYAWLPSYFNRYYGLPADLAALRTGLVVLASGVGSILWSLVADRMSLRFPRARLQVPAAAAALTAILMCLAFGRMAPGAAQFGVILAGAVAMTASVGPIAAVVIDVVHPAVRATAAAMVSLAQNLFGLAAGPLLAGALSDAYGLPFALSVMPLFCLLAGALFVVAARSYVRDLQSQELCAGSVAPPPGATRVSASRRRGSGVGHRVGRSATRGATRDGA
ncbi:MAG: MFS transporter [Candidatus Levyibacteriota bacterium]